jgi:hypothetical protein
MLENIITPNAISTMEMLNMNIALLCVLFIIFLLLYFNILAFFISANVKQALHFVKSILHYFCGKISYEGVAKGRNFL